MSFVVSVGDVGSDVRFCLLDDIMLSGVKFWFIVLFFFVILWCLVFKVLLFILVGSWVFMVMIIWLLGFVGEFIEEVVELLSVFLIVFMFDFFFLFFGIFLDIL